MLAVVSATYILCDEGDTAMPTGLDGVNIFATMTFVFPSMIFTKPPTAFVTIISFNTGSTAT